MRQRPSSSWVLRQERWGSLALVPYFNTAVTKVRDWTSVRALANAQGLRYWPGRSTTD